MILIDAFMHGPVYTTRQYLHYLNMNYLKKYRFFSDSQFRYISNHNQFNNVLSRVDFITKDF